MIFALPFLLAAAMPPQASAASIAPRDAPPLQRPTSYRLGREADARVAGIAFRLAVAGRSRCSAPQPAIGLVLQHLAQFRPEDRPALIATEHLDRGPEAIVVVPGSPADQAGIRASDILSSVAGDALPPETDLTGPFDPSRAHERADAIEDRLGRSAGAPFTVTLLRDGASVTVRVAPLPGCPSRVLLARSDQRNAYADGRHVFLTTGLVARVRSDDELAFIVAHEMAHNILRHAAVMRSDAVGHGLGRTLGSSGRIIRETEREADALGGELMIAAGFDPVAGAAVLDRMGTDLGIALFATHDPAARRIAAMRALVAAHAAP